MGFFARVRRELVDAFKVNLEFLTSGFKKLPQSTGFAATELRELIERDMAILVHQRNKWVEGNEPARERWFSDLEAFVGRTLRPKLAGQSVIALWNDVALMRMLDSMVENEQVALARAPSRLPVTCRFDSNWAN